MLFSFFKNFDFPGCQGYNSGTVPHTWILIHLCKMVVSPSIFFTLKNSLFLVFRGEDKKAKKLPIITNFSLLHSISQEL